MSQEVKGEVGGMSTYPAEGCDPGEAMIAVYVPLKSVESINLRDEVTLTISEGAAS